MQCSEKTKPSKHAIGSFCQQELMLHMAQDSQGKMCLRKPEPEHQKKLKSLHIVIIIISPALDSSFSSSAAIRWCRGTTARHRLLS